MSILKNKVKKIITDLIDENSYHVMAYMKNKEAFGHMKGVNNGKSIVLCGAGPSLKEYEPISNAIHVALNRAILYEKVKFDYMIADDWDGIDFIQKEVTDYQCQKFFGMCIGADYGRRIPNLFIQKNNASSYVTDSYYIRNGFDSKFVVDIDSHAVGNMPNIALEAMQILLFTNPEKIYLVGCDCSSGHFVQPSSLSKERIKNQEKDLKKCISGDATINKWLELKEFAKFFYPETEIVSINPVGLKGIFTDVYQ